MPVPVASTWTRDPRPVDEIIATYREPDVTWGLGGIDDWGWLGWGEPGPTILGTATALIEARS
jgi:hypothetical protein